MPPMQVVVICRFCGSRHDFDVDRDGYRRWQSGALIQQALPELDLATRELLVSGMCPGCWERTFGAEDNGVEMMDIVRAMYELDGAITRLVAAWYHALMLNGTAPSVDEASWQSITRCVNDVKVARENCIDVAGDDDNIESLITMITVSRKHALDAWVKSLASGHALVGFKGGMN